jgi:hypothetical protein
MASDVLTLFLGVCSVLEAAATPRGAAVVKTGQIPDAADWPRIDGQIKPTMIPMMGTPDDQYIGGDGIIVIAYDMQYIDGAVLCVAERYTDCLSLVGLVNQTLRGLRLSNEVGQIMMYGSPVRDPVADLTLPSRFAQTIGFGMSTGAKLVVP